MKRFRKFIGVAVTAAAIGGLWFGYASLYAGPRDDLRAEIENYQKWLSKREEETADLPHLKSELKKIATSTLGSDEETASAALRSALNEVLSHYRLTDASVATRRPEAVINPASAASVPEFKGKDAKLHPDLFAINATVSARGTLEHAMRALGTIQSQTWVHRVNRFALEPIGKGREQVELTIELTSIYLPEKDLRGNPVKDRIWEPIPDAAMARYQPVWQKNIFKAPAAPAIVTSPPPSVNQASAPAPSPAGAALADWRVSAVVQGREGAELWLVNLRTGQRTTLAPGGEVLGAVFEACQSELAMIRIGDEKFSVALGQTLADRRPVSR